MQLLRKIHPLTTLALALCLAISIAPQDMLIFTAFFSVTAFLMIIYEANRLSSLYQAAALLVTGSVGGIAADTATNTFPLLTAGMILASFSIGYPIVFFRRSGHTLPRLSELVMSIAALAAVTAALLLSAAKASLFIIPVVFSFLSVITRMRRRSTTLPLLQKGQQVPVAELKSLGMDPVPVNAEAKKGMLLIFLPDPPGISSCLLLRGHEKERGILEAAGIQIIAISPRPDFINKRISQTLGIGFPVVSNPELSLYRIFGISRPAPLSFLLDRKGRVCLSPPAEGIFFPSSQLLSNLNHN